MAACAFVKAYIISFHSVVCCLYSLRSCLCVVSPSFGIRCLLPVILNCMFVDFVVVPVACISFLYSLWNYGIFGVSRSKCLKFVHSFDKFRYLNVLRIFQILTIISRWQNYNFVKNLLWGFSLDYADIWFTASSEACVWSLFTVLKFFA